MGSMQPVQPIPLGQPLHRFDGRAIGLGGIDEAGARGLAVEQYGAGPAHPVLAADMGPEEPELVPKEISEQQASKVSFR